MKRNDWSFFEIENFSMEIQYLEIFREFRYYFRL